MNLDTKESEDESNQLGNTFERTDEGENGELDAPEWTGTHWLESKRAKRLVTFDIVLTIVIGVILIQ